MTEKDRDMTELPIGDIVVGDRHRQEPGDIDSLARSIRDLGLLHPVVITADKRLVAGARRLAALKELGRAVAPVRVVDSLDDALLTLRAERDENTCRKDFTPSEAVRIGTALEALEKEEAKERQKEGGRAGGKGSGKLPEAQTGDTRDKVAEAVGMSGRTYEKVKQVLQAAEADPELRPVVEEMDRTGKVEPALKKVRVKQPDKRRKKRPRYYGDLDADTRTILGEHRAGYAKGHTKALWTIPTRATRQAAARLLVEGKAKDVKGALAMLTGDAPPQAGVATAPEIEEQGQGMALAKEAINSLMRIPKNDRLRQRGFETVIDWIKHNR
jgi:hypothetical protein